ncbi:MAG: hypothetical protein COW71_16240 [Ignavibacteriales bacterium CG18_big_fil_WC_8_21_14_2_50_31_20]|nr:MAG: hypothetical protein COW71_16240 [Ignavibacteriales bacterium CG18_big_fil_WC_8_21_14_2_50_31_20]
MNNGAIDKEIELLKEKKQSIDEMINRLKNGKDKRKISINEILRHNGLDRIDGGEYWLKRDTSKSTRVIINKVEDQYKTYQLPKLSNSEYRILIDILEYLLETEAGEISKDEFYLTSSIITKFKVEKLETCGVKDLPKDHEALEITAIPTIRIYNKRAS